MSSINNTPNASRTRKKALGTVLIGALVAGGVLVGGTYANLNQTITDGDDSSHIYSEPVNKFGFVYHSATQVIDADISITDTMSFNRQVTPFVAENIGSIPAQYAFYVDPASVPTLDLTNPIWDEAHAIVHIPTDSGLSDTWVGTVREFLSTAFVTNDILKPGESEGVTVEILPPTTYTWTSEESAAAVDIRFGSKFTFNQLTDPANSPLYLYAIANGEQRGGIFDADMNINFRDQLRSSMTHSYTLPSSAITGITL